MNNRAGKNLEAYVGDGPVQNWLDNFRFYRNPPDRNRVIDWLSQFDEADRPVAEKVLDRIQVVSDEDILVGYRDFLESCDGWSKDPSKRVGRWFFVGFGGSGESGEHMVRLFREANRINSDDYAPLCVYLRELPKLGLTAEDTVVFIDDIAGSGDQACRLWPTIQELMASEARAILLLTAVTYRAEKRIRNETQLELHPKDFLGTDADFFHVDFEGFSDDEKAIIARYCEVADKVNPRGYGECALLYVLAHKTPNNCLPIVHAYNTRWRGILPRYTPLPR